MPHSIRSLVLFATLIAVPACGGGEGYVVDSQGCMIAPEMAELSNHQPLQIMTFQRLCTGEKQPTTNVSIVHRDSMPDGPGNVLVAVDSAGAEDSASLPFATGTFDGSTTATVTYDPAARIIKRDSVVRGFTVRYRFTDSLLNRFKK